MRRTTGGTQFKIRTLLEEEREARAREAHRRAVSRAGARDIPLGDEGDLAFASMDEQREHLEIRRISSSVRSIDAALLTLEVGRYGTCLCCREPIPRRRLRALPTAILCRECQERTEAAREETAR